MKTIILLFCLLPFNSFAAPAKLKYSIDFIFARVLEKKNQTYRAEVPFPQFRFESETPLKDFQDAIESQWGMRPDRFTNAFAMESNQIFILDDSAYYNRHQRCMDDSVAHELVHYIQSKYQGWDMNDESLEWQAIEIQTAFREEFCHQ